MAAMNVALGLVFLLTAATRVWFVGAVDQFDFDGRARDVHWRPWPAGMPVGAVDEVAGQADAKTCCPPKAFQVDVLYFGKTFQRLTWYEDNLHTRWAYRFDDHGEVYLYNPKKHVVSKFIFNNIFCRHLVVPANYSSIPCLQPWLTFNATFWIGDNLSPMKAQLWVNKVQKMRVLVKAARCEPINIHTPSDAAYYVDGRLGVPDPKFFVVPKICQKKNSLRSFGAGEDGLSTL